MRLHRRIRELRLSELPTIEKTILAAEAAVAEADAQRLAYFSRKPEIDLFGTVKESKAPHSEAGQWKLEQLKEVWDPTRHAAHRWLHHARDTLYPMMIRWDEGETDLQQELHGLIDTHQELYSAFERHLTALRSQIMFIKPIRQPIHRALESVASLRRIEDVELVPAILSGEHRTSDQAVGRAAALHRTSDDVARSLRTAKPSPARASEPHGGFVGALRKLFGG